MPPSPGAFWRSPRFMTGRQVVKRPLLRGRINKAIGMGGRLNAYGSVCLIERHSRGAARRLTFSVLEALT